MLSVPDSVRSDPHLRGVAKERMAEAIKGITIPGLDITYRLGREAVTLRELHEEPRAWGEVLDRDISLDPAGDGIVVVTGQWLGDAITVLIPVDPFWAYDVPALAGYVVSRAMGGIVEVVRRNATYVSPGEGVRRVSEAR